MKKLLLSTFLFGLTSLSFQVFAQGDTEYGSGLKVNLNDDGSKYVRFITWHQVWTRYNENNSGSTRLGQPQESTLDFGLRRSRFLMLAQLNNRFLILTHFGINNQNAISGGYLGTDGKKPQIYMHDAWVEYAVMQKYLSIGFGLNYWNGVSRLSNASTLNFMTVDAPIFNWPTIEATDQFARKIGVYAKGKIGKLDYRIALSDPFKTNTSGAIATNRANYSPSNSKKVFEGYLNWQFWDQESNVLPYTVGTYLGTKKVFNIGAGWSMHPDAMWYRNDAGDTVFSDMMLFGVDAFLDLPINDGKNAITAYAAFYNYDFGPNNFRNIGIMNPSDGGGLMGNSFPTVGTGTIMYAQAGYLFKTVTEGLDLQPFGAFSTANFEGLKNANNESVPVNVFDLGCNFYLQGHHAKFTFNYRRRPDFTDVENVVGRNEFLLQAMVYL